MLHMVPLMVPFGVFKKICKLSLLDLINNISVNNVYVKYIFIYLCSSSKLFLFQNSMILNAAPGPDGFPAILLKKCRKALAPPLARIWRQSMSNGEIPTTWFMVARWKVN